MMSGFDLPVRPIRQQFASAIDLIIQAQRLTGGPRKVVGVTEVTGMEGEMITMQDIFKFEQVGVNSSGAAYGRFIATGIRPTFLERLASAGAPVDPGLFEQQVLMAEEDAYVLDSLRATLIGRSGMGVVWVAPRGSRRG